MEWFFPRSLEEVPELLLKEGVVPHGGGTALLRAGVGRFRGLVDLSRLPLGYMRIENAVVSIGATMSYAETASRMRRHDPEHVLVKSLSRAASTPLRNRITVGGGIANAPMWSDLLGPLVALDAEVVLLRSEDGRTKRVPCDVVDFVRLPELKRGALVTEVRFRDEPWISFYHRQTRVRFDYPAFTLTILVKPSGGKIDDIRIVVSGTTERVTRLLAVEEKLQGKDVRSLRIEGMGANLPASFPDKRAGSGGHFRHVAGVVLERGLEEITRCVR